MPPEPPLIYTLPRVLSTWIFSLREAEAELAHQLKCVAPQAQTFLFMYPRLGVLRYTLAQILHWLSSCYRRISADHTGIAAR